MNDISASRITQAIAAMKAIDSAWLTPGQRVTARMITDLLVARLDLESALTNVRLNINTHKEAA